MKIKIDNNKNLWLIYLILISITVRIYFCYFTNPVVGVDGPGYIDLAKKIQLSKIDLDNGSRTPVYPLILILFKLNIYYIRIFQMCLGVIITFIIYMMVLELNKRPLYAFIAGMFYGINIVQIQLENMIMTETITTFIIILFIFMLFKFDNNYIKENNGIKWFLCAGVFSALAGLIRPIFVFINPFIILIALLKWKKLKKRWIILFYIPFLVLIGGWSLYNYYRLNYFGLTTFTGYNLTNHSGKFFEKVSDKNNSIREIYLEEREKRLAEVGNYSGTIWRCYDRMMKTNNLSFADLSKRLTKISINLFYENPILYFKSVSKSYLLFWYVSKKIQWEKARSIDGETIMIKTINIERIFLIGMNIIFLLLILIYLYLHLKYKYTIHNNIISISIIIILIFSIVQAFVEFGANNRYMLPVQPIIIINCVYLIKNLNNINC